MSSSEDEVEMAMRNTVAINLTDDDDDDDDDGDVVAGMTIDGSEGVHEEVVGDSRSESESGQASARGCCAAAAPVVGWAFDVVTAAISVADVVSDVLVAIQFAAEERWVWLGLVLGSLFLSNCIVAWWCTLVGVKTPPFRPLDRLPRFVVAPVAFLIAPLLPLVMWGGQVAVRCGGCADQEDETGGFFGMKFMDEQTAEGIRTAGTWANDGSAADAAVREEFEAAATSASVLGSLEAGLARHMKAHALFYVECIVEAIPQAVIQLLAMTFLDEASGVQIVSTLLSLATIASKAYVVSRCFDLRTFIFKYALVVHDVFCLFYAFATLLSRQGRLDWDLFGAGIPLSYMAVAWMFLFAAKCLATLVLIGASGILYLVTQVCKNGDCKVNIESVCQSFTAVLLALLLGGPVAIVMEGMKLSWAPFIDLVNGAPVDRFAALSTQLAFLRRGNFQQRLRHIAAVAVRRHIIDASAPVGTVDGTPIRLVNKDRLRGLWSLASLIFALSRDKGPAQRWLFEQTLTHQLWFPQDKDYLRATTPLPMLHKAELDVIEELRLTKDDVSDLRSWRPFDSDAKAEFTARLDVPTRTPRSGSALTTPSSSGRSPLSTTASLFPQARPPIRRAGTTTDTIGQRMAQTWMVIYGAGQALGFLFPFVNAAVEGWSGQNPIQIACLVMIVVSLLVAAVTAHSAWQYLGVRVVNSFLGPLVMDTAELERSTVAAVAEAVVPPHHVVLATVIPRSVVPALLTVNLVARYVTPHSIGTHTMSVSQCDACTAAGFDPDLRLPSPGGASIVAELQDVSAAVGRLYDLPVVIAEAVAAAPHPVGEGPPYLVVNVSANRLNTAVQGHLLRRRR